MRVKPIIVGVDGTDSSKAAVRRGRGVVAGALLGSTGLQLLHHADCPVYIVRRTADGSN